MKRRFDWILDENLPRPDNFWDVELIGNESFSVVPSLGSIVPGWVLVVPRIPVLNFCELDERRRSSLTTLLTDLRARLSLPNHEVFQFEHGSRHQGSAMGCGIDQAHLHVVPLKFDLLEAVLKNEDKNISWSEIPDAQDPWKDIPPEHEYILVRGKGTILLGSVVTPVSQWVRRVIASETNCANAWDYNRNAGTENILRTRAMVGR